MKIEFNHYEGRKYSSVTFRKDDDRPVFVGLVDWSPSRDFGLAVGKYVGSNDKHIIFLAGGEPVWSEPAGNPLDVRIVDQGIGAFVDGRSLVVFQVGGVMFRVPLDPPLAIESCEVTDEGLSIRSGLWLRRYDFRGNLTYRGTQK